MADVAQNVQPIRREVAAMQVLVGGRIDSARVYEGKQYTTITTPARDEFAMPSVIEVKGLRKLGEVGSRVNGILCHVSGYIREFTYPDKKTGEVKPGRETNVYFEVVE